jgi:integrase
VTSRKANGSGSVYRRRTDGRWAGMLYVTEADGRRIRRTFYGKTRQDVERRLVEVRSKAEAGVPMTPSRLTLGAYLEEWLTQIVAPRVRPNTLAAYRFHVERHLTPDLGARKLGKLTAREVRLYLDSLKQRGEGVRTIRYVHATLRAALEDAMREELIEKNVAKLVRPPATPRSERHPLSVEEIRMFLKATREDRLHALYVVIAILGLRRSEALGLMWADVDLDAGTLCVVRGLHRVGGRLLLLDTKTARSRRTIPLPEPVRQVLTAHRERQEQERVELAERWPASGHVFTTAIGTPLDPDNCSKAVKAALERSGVRPVRLHDFRHGCVSVLLGLGVPPRTVMEIAGHSALEMTMNVYAHVTLDDKRAALDRLGRLLEEGEK